jgi:hypothetical protein
LDQVVEPALDGPEGQHRAAASFEKEAVQCRVVRITDGKLQKVEVQCHKLLSGKDAHGGFADFFSLCF